MPVSRNLKFLYYRHTSPHLELHTYNINMWRSRYSYLCLPICGCIALKQSISVLMLTDSLLNIDYIVELVFSLSKKKKKKQSYTSFNTTDEMIWEFPPIKTHFVVLLSEFRESHLSHFFLTN